MPMKKYTVLQNFKGSPNGMVSLDYKKGQEVAHDYLGSDLAAVAVDEQWIEQIESAIQQAGLADIIAAIAKLDAQYIEPWKAGGKPTVHNLNDLLNRKITAAERDNAFAAFNQSKL